MKNPILNVACLIIGFVAGLAAATQLFAYRTDLDYDSGNVRNVMLIGPIVVREDIVNHEFGATYLPNGKQSMRGTPNWKVALLFRGNSKKSALTEAGMLLNRINGICGLLPHLNHTKTATLKHMFLTILQSSGPSAAQAFLAAKETELLEEIQSLQAAQ